MFVTIGCHIAIKTTNSKNNVKYLRFFSAFCLHIKLYAYICNVFFMVLELRLTKIGCRDDNQFFCFKAFGTFSFHIRRIPKFIIICVLQRGFPTILKPTPCCRFSLLSRQEGPVPTDKHNDLIEFISSIVFS